MSDHALEAVHAADRSRAPAVGRRSVAPVPARAPDVLAQPDRRVLQLPAAAAVAGDVRRDVRRRAGGPRRDRAGHRRDERDGGDVRRRSPTTSRSCASAGSSSGCAARRCRPRPTWRGSRPTRSPTRCSRSRVVIVAGRCSSASPGRATGSRCWCSWPPASSASRRSASRSRTRSPTSSRRPAYVNAVFLPMIILAGVFYDDEDAPALLRDIAEAMPLKHLIDGLSGAMVHGEGLADHWSRWSCSRCGRRPASCSRSAASRGRRGGAERGRGAGRYCARRPSPTSRPRRTAPRRSRRSRRGCSCPRAGCALCGGLFIQARRVARGVPSGAAAVGDRLPPRRAAPAGARRAAP